MVVFAAHGFDDLDDALDVGLVVVEGFVVLIETVLLDVGGDQFVEDVWKDLF